MRKHLKSDFIKNMGNREFQKTLDSILKDDKRFKVGAYVFVRMALDWTVKNAISTNPERRDKHVTAKEFLEGIKEFALQTFGPMSKVLFDEWGVKSCKDIGAIVFNLIDAGALRKTDDDKIEDFYDGYDFEEAFVKPFLPRRKKL